MNYETFPEIGQFRQPITVVRSKRKKKTYTSDIVPMIGHTTLSFSLIQMENINLNYDYGLQRHRPQIYSGSKFADNTFQNYILKY